jgi:F-type H+-transporting ATPase subunit O
MLRSAAASLAGRRIASTAVRAMSTANPTVPAKVFGLSGRYASALYMSASKTGALEAVEKDFSALSDALSTDQQFARFIVDPTIPRVDKMKNMEKATASSNETTQKIVAVLAENGRLPELSNVIRDYKTIMLAHRKETIVTVTTAAPMDESLRSQTIKELAEYVDGAEVTLVEKVPSHRPCHLPEACRVLTGPACPCVRLAPDVACRAEARGGCQVDESILGGMVVLLPGDRLIDNSYAKRMDKIMKHLKAE